MITPATAFTQHNIAVTVSGRYELKATKVDGSSERVLAAFDNLILNSGLDQLLTSPDPGNQAYDEFWGEHVVGASGAEEDPSQTGLLALVSTTTQSSRAVVTWQASNPLEWVFTSTSRFPAGSAAGNIAEVGVKPRWSDNLFSRALVRDVDGQPTTIQVGSDEFLDVTYVFTLRVDPIDRPFTINISSGSHSGVLRKGYLTASIVQSFARKGFGNPAPRAGSTATGYSHVSAGALGPAGGDIPQPEVSAAITAAIATYTPGAFYRDVTYSMGLDEGNIVAPGFKALHIGDTNSGGLQLSFDPPIPKTAERIFRVTVRISVSRS